MITGNFKDWKVGDKLKQYSLSPAFFASTYRKFFPISN